MTILRSIVFTVLIPGTVAYLVPIDLLARYGKGFDPGFLLYLGYGIVLCGIVIYGISTISFLVEGGGTPAIYFTKKLRYLIGEEPQKMVSRGIYRFSRNPMYVAVVGTVVGEGFIWGSVAVLVYSAFLWLLFHLVVVFLEEPHLLKKYGNEYEEFLTRTHRWIGWS
jgi:protein-S-isoprenylcysteine O-methyltransferase Ste14